MTTFAGTYACAAAARHHGVVDGILTVCPVCGWDGLTVPPYQRWPGLPAPAAARPPYEDFFGPGSYEVCSCCGFEFGFEDHPGAGDGVSFEEYRREWIDAGSRWWSERRPSPPGWDGLQQLKRRGLLP